ncbi:MAG: NUDIX domain-containing protein [Melioribacteraceae bacterium]|nr:NUDIX domain-containing protein [Melioribacteraceae bacterium]
MGVGTAGGKLDDNEDPQICATRELTEETGYTAGKVTKLGTHLYNTRVLQ